MINIIIFKQVSYPSCKNNKYNILLIKGSGVTFF